MKIYGNLLFLFRNVFSLGFITLNNDQISNFNYFKFIMMIDLVFDFRKAVLYIINLNLGGAFLKRK